jgi:hypothetical protein
MRSGFKPRASSRSSTGGAWTGGWEFYSAPFRVDLSDALRERLASSWRYRDPRV